MSIKFSRSWKADSPGESYNIGWHGQATPTLSMGGSTFQQWSTLLNSTWSSTKHIPLNQGQVRRLRCYHRQLQSSPTLQNGEDNGGKGGKSDAERKR